MFEKLKVEYKSKLISNLAWRLIPIPTYKELKNSPIHIKWHSNGEHPIIGVYLEVNWICSAKNHFRNCFSQYDIECFSCEICDFKICKQCL